MSKQIPYLFNDIYYYSSETFFKFSFVIQQCFFFMTVTRVCEEHRVHIVFDYSASFQQHLLMEYSNGTFREHTAPVMS